MRRREFSRTQSKAIVARVPRLIILWVLVTLCLAAAASFNRDHIQPVDGDSRFTLQNAPAIVQSLIEKYAPK